MQESRHRLPFDEIRFVEEELRFGPIMVDEFDEELFTWIVDDSVKNPIFKIAAEVRNSSINLKNLNKWRTNSPKINITAFGKDEHEQRGHIRLRHTDDLLIQIAQKLRTAWNVFSVV